MSLNLTDLLAPQLLAGPLGRIKFIPFLQVDVLHTSLSEEGIVFSGVTSFGNTILHKDSLTFQKSLLGPVFKIADPSDLTDLNIEFRLTIPRHGSSEIKSWLTPPPAALGTLSALLNDLDADYPGTEFRLEFMFRTLTLKLDGFKSATLTEDGMLVADNGDDVQLLLPNLAFVLTQGATWGDVKFQFAGWGGTGLDTFGDGDTGRVIEMSPPYALHDSENWGFGFESAILDLSADQTPSEIREIFGTGDDFQGLYFPHLMLYVRAKKAQQLKLAAHARGLLIDFDHGVSGEFAIDVVNGKRGDVVLEPILTQNGAVSGKADKRPRKYGIGRTVKSTVELDNSLETFLTFTKVDADNGAFVADVSFRFIGSGVDVKVNHDPVDPAKPNDPLQWRLPSGIDFISIVVTSSNQVSGAFEVIRVQEIAIQHRDFISTSGAWKVRLGPSKMPEDLDKIRGGEDCGTLISPATVQMDINVDLQKIESVVGPAAASPAPGKSGYMRFLVPITPGAPGWYQFKYKQFISGHLGGYSPIPGTNSDQVSDNNAYPTILWPPSSTALAPALFPPYLASTVDDALRKDPGPLWVVAQYPRGTGSVSIAETQLANVIAWLQTFTIAGQRILGTVGLCRYESLLYSTLVQIPSGTVIQEVTVSFCVIPRNPAEYPKKHRDPLDVRFIELHVRIKLIRNELVLAEVRAKVDFKTLAEKALEKVTDAHTPTAIFNPNDGQIWFKLKVVHDIPANRWMEEIAVDADPADKDGLLHTRIGDNTDWKDAPNILTAIAVFAPVAFSIINQPKFSVLDAAGGAALGTALLLAVRAGRVILYGARVLSTQRETTDGLKFENATVLFDYGASFALNLDFGFLRIWSTPLPDPAKPNERAALPQVRYKSLGFELDAVSGFKPVFDASAGYELNLASGGQLSVDVLSFPNFLQVNSLRIRRRSLEVEVDLSVLANLGVISVSNFRITAEFEGKTIKKASVQGIAVSIDIPNTIKGKGILDIRNNASGGVDIKGGMDITLIAAKLRIAAGIRLESIAGRKAKAVLILLRVEFPAPIPFASSGLGLYGLLGMFGMHFMRTEAAGPLPPALQWFIKNDPTDINAAWEKAPDHWSIGVGAILGTQDGGYVIKLTGLLLFELPGPRIIIAVSVKMVNAKGASAKQLEGADKPKTTDVQIVGVVDLDFYRHQITIAALINYTVTDVIRITVPVEAFFRFRDRRDWHFYSGTLANPMTAELLFLGNAKATAYFMIEGKELKGFPTPQGLVNLPGLAIALGFYIGIVLQAKKNGKIRLVASASLDVAVSFKPLLFYGTFRIAGEIHIYKFSLSVWAELSIQGPDHFKVHGEICAEIKLRIARIKGCIDFTIERGATTVEPAAELVLGFALQARSPALVEGQGTDTAIDGTVANEPNGSTNVPIDVVPIVKMRAAPLLGGFTSASVAAPAFPPRSLPGGIIRFGPSRYLSYTLRSVTLTPAKGPALTNVPCTWLALSPFASGQDTALDLALLSWEPVSDSKASLLSEDLRSRVRDRWGGMCRLPAPAARVLWTFHDSPLGESTKGWGLSGLPLPDPPDSVRSVAPDLNLRVLDRPPVETALMATIAAYSGSGVKLPSLVIGDRTAPVTARGPLGKQIILMPAFTRRVLRFPRWEATPATSPSPVAPGAQSPRTIAAIDRTPEPVILESGRVESVRLLIGCQKEDWSKLTLNGQPLPAPVAIADETALLGAWPNPATGWALNLTLAFGYLKAAGAACYYVEVTDSKLLGDRILLRLSQPGGLAALGAIELLRHSEVERAAVDQGIQTTDQQSIRQTMAPQPLPLLEKGTQYTLAVQYDTHGDGFKLPSKPSTAVLTFTTATAAPEKLHPYVLATAPYADEPFFFRDEPVQVVFNHPFVIDLFKKYGKDLKYILRDANQTAPKREAYLANAPKTVGTAPVSNQAVVSPFENAVRELLAANGAPCLTTGSTPLVPTNPNTTAILVNPQTDPLLPSTTYTLEVIAEDSSTSVTHTGGGGLVGQMLARRVPATAASSVIIKRGPVPVDLQPITPDPKLPLFQLNFTTSHYHSAGAFAAEILAAAQNPGHQYLKATLVPLAADPQMAIPDVDFEALLAACGITREALPETPRVTILWTQTQSAWRPAGVVIEAPEPMFRRRPIPKLVTVKSQNGDIQQYENALEDILRLQESGGGTAVERIRHAFGGSRAFIWLKPGSTATQLQLDLVRDYPSPLRTGLQSSAAALACQVSLSSAPPWLEVEG